MLGAGAVSWLCTRWRQGAGAGAGAVSWLCTRWRQGAGAGAGAVSSLCTRWRQGAGAGAGAVSWLCAWWSCARGGWVLAAHVVERVPSAGYRCWVLGCMNLCTQHHTVLSLERSLSISAVGYLHSSGSVLADSCVKGCTACAHTFARIPYNVLGATSGSQPTIVSACYTHNSRAGYCLALGE